MYFLHGINLAEAAADTTPFGPSAVSPNALPVSATGVSISTPAGSLVMPGAPEIGGVRSGKKKKKKKGPEQFAVPVKQRPSRNWVITGAILGVVMAGFLVYKYAGLVRKP